MRNNLGEGRRQLTGAERHAIGARLRELLGSRLSDLPAAAKLLGVEEVSLRMSVDETSPFPTVDVLLRMVAHFGVDPGYLLTGQYNGSTHRQALDSDSGTTEQTIRRLANLQQPSTPVSELTDEPDRFRTA